MIRRPRRSNKIVRQSLAAILLSVASFTPGIYAGEVTDRSVSLSTSAPGESANYTFNFTAPSGDIIRSFVAEVCETASGTCTAPAGFTAGSATLLNQPLGFGDASGWSVDTTDSGLLRMHNATNGSAPGASQSVTFGSVVNPTAINTTYFLRLSTYANANYTDEIDSGVVAASTTQELTVSGFVPPILTFCVAVSIPGDCTTATGTNINLGTFSPSVTAAGTSQMRASTNAGDGYAITIEGTTLSSGTNTIPALATQTTSQTGVSQFGINLRDNASPNVGAEPSGSGAGTPATGYNTVNQFQLNGGDIVASAPGPTNHNTFTVAYITNIEPAQAAGNYSTTLTYVATATF